MEDEVPPSISEYIVRFYARKKTKKEKPKHEEIVVHTKKKHNMRAQRDRQNRDFL